MKRLLVEVVAGFIIAVAGGLLLWGSVFADNFVHDQLDEQKIVFPPKGSSPEKVLDTYGGQAVDDGTKARAYAEEYIKVHLKEINDGKTYAETSNESRTTAAELDKAKKAGSADAAEVDRLTQESNALKGKTDSLFRGETLRGLLLYAWGWWLIGRIAFWVSIFLFIAAVGLVLAAMTTRPHHGQPQPTPSE